MTDSVGRDSVLARTRPASPEGDEWTAMLLGVLSCCGACAAALPAALRATDRPAAPDTVDPGLAQHPSDPTPDVSSEVVLDCLLGVIATGRHLRQRLSAAAPRRDDPGRATRPSPGLPPGMLR